MKLRPSILVLAFFVFAPWALAAEPPAAPAAAELAAPELAAPELAAPGPAAMPVAAVSASPEASSSQLLAPADCPLFGAASAFPGSSTYCGRCSQHLCRGEDVGAVCDTGRVCVVSTGVCSIGGMTCSCV